MRLPFITLLFLFPLMTFAQSGTISGKITNAETGAVLPKASVFLTETYYSTSTNNDGTFTLKGVKPGKYVLVITMIGFEKFSQNVSVGADAVPLNISLTPHITPLGEVTIKLPKDWERNFKMFFNGFVGRSWYARKCKILNSEVLNFSYDKKKDELSAWSDGLIRIENRALGYILNITVTRSTFHSNGGAYYYNDYFFEELPGTPEEVKKWQANRVKLSQDPDRNHFIAGEKLPGNMGKQLPLQIRKNKN